jgi:hypothetical protein
LSARCAGAVAVEVDANEVPAQVSREHDSRHLGEDEVCGI